MIERGEIFLRRISLSRNKIADLCHTFIKDGARILTHAYSRVVLRVLEAAVAAKKRFSVYITESQPDLSGQVSFPVVMCPAVPLMSKLRMRLHCKSSQTKSPICLSISIAFHTARPCSWKKNHHEFGVGHSTASRGFI